MNDTAATDAATATTVVLPFLHNQHADHKTAYILTNLINLFKCSQLFRAGKYQEQ